MDLITSIHGLAKAKLTGAADDVDVSSLSKELQQELKRLEDEFTVSADKLKAIVKQFERELQDGEPG